MNSFVVYFQQFNRHENINLINSACELCQSFHKFLANFEFNFSLFFSNLCSEILQTVSVHNIHVVNCFILLDIDKTDRLLWPRALICSYQKEEQQFQLQNRTSNDRNCHEFVLLIKISQLKFKPNLLCHITIINKYSIKVHVP